MAVVTKSWDGSAGRFTDEQYARSCVLDRKSCGGEWASKPPKERCSLPIREPNGDLNKNAVYAVAARINQVTGACPGAISAAKARLRSAYNTIGEPVPDNLKGSSESKSQEPMGADKLFEVYGAIPGVPRHGQQGFRGVIPLEVVRSDEASSEGYLGILHGHFAVFNRWTEINSFFEGRFMERIAPSAFKKTFQENVKSMRCLFQHGKDPMIGMKSLGPIRSVCEDQEGAAYEVSLYDTSYNRDLFPALKDGQYGASFRFHVIREEVNARPERSETNPEGIEERTITEVKVSEFGPVTFPAYADATAGVRCRSLIEATLRDEIGEASWAALTRSGQYYHEILRSLESNRTQEAAPPKDAPDHESTPAPVRSTHLAGAAPSLRTNHNLEEPKWKL